jgi:hypothetical protein
MAASKHAAVIEKWRNTARAAVFVGLQSPDRASHAAVNAAYERVDRNAQAADVAVSSSRA